MDTFSSILSKLRQSQPHLFHEESRSPAPPDNPPVDVRPVRISTEKELRDRVGANQDADWSENPNEPKLEARKREAMEPPVLQREREVFEESERSRRFREPFLPDHISTVDVELLAVYRPFHYYDDNDWGVLFFEHNLRRFVDYIHSGVVRNGLWSSWDFTLKVVTYAVARHEVAHYLVELQALGLELQKGQRVFVPYFETVYKKSYPRIECVDETVANAWACDNAVVRSPVVLQKIIRAALSIHASPAYKVGAALNRLSVRPKEDILSAQLNQIAVLPMNPPALWGLIPRPYVQPWTRYENVPFSMTVSDGGWLGSRLASGPIKKTIRIYHV